MTSKTGGVERRTLGTHQCVRVLQIRGTNSLTFNLFKFEFIDDAQDSFRSTIVTWSSHQADRNGTSRRQRQRSTLDAMFSRLGAFWSDGRSEYLPLPSFSPNAVRSEMSGRTRRIVRQRNFKIFTLLLLLAFVGFLWTCWSVVDVDAVTWMLSSSKTLLTRLAAEDDRPASEGLSSLPHP